MKVNGDDIFPRKWFPKENSIVLGKFRRGWLELRGLLFHLWDETQLNFKAMRESYRVGKGDFRVDGFDEGKVMGGNEP